MYVSRAVPSVTQRVVLFWGVLSVRPISARSQSLTRVLQLRRCGSSPQEPLAERRVYVGQRSVGAALLQ